MAQIGVNAWVWTSPVNTDEFGRLAPMVKRMGFDLIEFGIESTSDLDYARAAEVARANGLGVSVCAAMGPDRDLIHSDESIRKNGMDYVRHCIDAAKTVGAKNVIGPLYSAVGRTWQSTDDERKRDTDLLVRQLKELSQLRRRPRRRAGGRAAESVRDELHEPGLASDRGRRSRRSSGVRHPARYLPHEHRGAIDRRRDPRRRQARAPDPHLRKRSRRARVGPRALAGSREGLPRHRLQRSRTSSSRSPTR